MNKKSKEYARLPNWLFFYGCVKNQLSKLFTNQNNFIWISSAGLQVGQTHDRYIVCREKIEEGGEGDIFSLFFYLASGADFGRSQNMSNFEVERLE